MNRTRTQLSGGSNPIAGGSSLALIGNASRGHFWLDEKTSPRGVLEFPEYPCRFLTKLITRQRLLADAVSIERFPSPTPRDRVLSCCGQKARSRDSSAVLRRQGGVLLDGRVVFERPTWETRGRMQALISRVVTKYHRFLVPHQLLCVTATDSINL